MLKKFIIITIVIIIVLFGLMLLRGSEDTWLCTEAGWVKHGMPSAEMPTEPCVKMAINSFDNCVKNGNPVMESYPRQCRAGERSFTEDIGNELEKSDLIRIDYPRPNQKIISPLAITGQARGTWFFEATFPIKLTDEQGNILAQHYATAKSDWMTNEFVEFEATLEFSQPSVNSGQLILAKDNPSGLPENADSLIIPVEF